MTVEMLTPTAAHMGRYLSFRLAGEEYGLEILKVQEIIGMLNVTRVPRTPDWVRGVINLRGRVIPVIDARRKFGMPAEPDTEKTCIIIVHVGAAERRAQLGLVVDEVSEVLDIAPEAIEPPPPLETDGGVSFLSGLGKLPDRVLILVDIDRALADGVRDALADIVD